LGEALRFEPPFDGDSARDYALLRLANDSGWVPKDPERPDWLPIADPGLERALADWLARAPADGEHGRLYRRWSDPDGSPRLPVLSPAASELDALAMPRGPLWEALAPRIPLDLWLLQGEAVDFFLPETGSQAAVLFSLDPDSLAAAFPASLTLPLTLYQSILLAESLLRGQGLAEYAVSLSQWQSRSLFSSGVLARKQSRAGAIARGRTRSLTLSLSHSVSVSHSLSLVLTLAERLPLSPSPRSGVALTRAKKGIDVLQDEDKHRVANALGRFCYSQVALDWFSEQAEDLDLMRRRSLHPCEPLPREFGLFEPDGRLRDTLPRAGLVQLRDWLANDDAILAWTFPNGLLAADEAHLRSELHTLHHYERPDGGHGQPWSPLAAIEAALADWPESEPTRDVSLAAAERDLLAVLDDLFPERPDPAPD
jgi:hypothetical protein